jgi:hypothetical protein
MSDGSDKEVRKQINSIRFSWFENVSADAKLRKSGNALAMAAYVFRRFKAERGEAEFSIEGAARDLKMPPRSAVRARRALENRGWIRKVKGPRSQREGWSANVYILTGGPDDLELAEHFPTGDEDGDAGVGDSDGSDTGSSSKEEP